MKISRRKFIKTGLAATGGDGSGCASEDNPGSGGSGNITGPGNTTNVNDKNNDGYIDCYKNTIMRSNGLFINSGRNDIRQREDRTTYVHEAWDITGSGVDGTTVYATASGEVIDVSVQTTTEVDTETGQKMTFISGWGYYVKIKDNAGKIWIYAHLKGQAGNPAGIGLKLGTKVVAGLTPIGLGDSSGNSSGSPLHLEVRANSVKTCPDQVIGNC